MLQYFIDTDFVLYIDKITQAALNTVTLSTIGADQIILEL